MNCIALLPETATPEEVPYGILELTRYRKELVKKIAFEVWCDVRSKVYPDLYDYWKSALEVGKSHEAFIMEARIRQVKMLYMDEAQKLYKGIAKNEVIFFFTNAGVFEEKWLGV